MTSTATEEHDQTPEQMLLALKAEMVSENICNTVCFVRNYKNKPHEHCTDQHCIYRQARKIVKYLL